MKPIFLTFLLLFSFSAFAEFRPDRTVAGFVYDKESGEALIGASVLVSGTTRGTSTNTSGFFSITGLPDGELTLEIRYIGFLPQQKKIRATELKADKLNIQLEPATVSMAEVVVSADSIRTIKKLFDEPVSQLELSGLDIKKIPQIIEPDLLRSLQSLPGIVSASDFSSQIYVRGGTPDQNLYMVDGTDIYNPEHAFGLFSTFNTDAIKSVVISKGGFGAEYGGRLSSVIDVTNLDGNRNSFKGTANISLLSAKTTLQFPMGKIGSISGSIRRTYFDKTVGQVKSLKDKIPDYYFIDGNVKTLIDINETNKLTVSYFGGRDYLDFKFNPDAEDSDKLKYDWGNNTGSLKWLSVLSPELFANFWLTYSRFDSELNLKQIHMKETNEINDLTLKGNLEYTLSDANSVKFGFESKFLDPKYLSENDNEVIDVQGKRTHLSGYIQNQYKPDETWMIETGLRLDHFRADEYFTDLSPRLTVKYNLDAVQNIKFAAGVYRQYLQRIPRFFVGDIWVTSDKNIKPSTSNHYVLGYERVLDEAFTLQAELFYKTYTNLNSFKKFVVTDIIPSGTDAKNRTLFKNTKNLFFTGDGSSYGAEILVKKDMGLATGWLGYTYSHTEYQFSDINRNKTFSPRHDRSHTINATLNTELDEAWAKLWNSTPDDDHAKWLFGMNFIYSTGQPITTPGSAYFSSEIPDVGSDPLSQNGGNLGFSLYPGEINSYRLPDYIRMDISLTWEKKYTTWTLAPYFQVFNIGNRKNVWFIQYQDDSNIAGKIKPEIKKITMFPLLPTVGVTINF
ncbi:MAG: TonB-dependent receptor [Bacteroidetes bacterium]|nr:TonB-dependent receptor [Bacteroidota bacterium]